MPVPDAHQNSSVPTAPSVVPRSDLENGYCVGVDQAALKKIKANIKKWNGSSPTEGEEKILEASQGNLETARKALASNDLYSLESNKIDKSLLPVMIQGGNDADDFAHDDFSACSSHCSTTDSTETEQTIVLQCFQECESKETRLDKRVMECFSAR